MGLNATRSRKGFVECLGIAALLNGASVGYTAYSGRAQLGGAGDRAALALVWAILTAAGGTGLWLWERRAGRREPPPGPPYTVG